MFLWQLRKLAFAIKNSSTLILPEWFAILERLELSARMMPRDVKTRWNSTYDMLIFAVEYQDALNTLCGDRELKLRAYEMSTAEWMIATQLCDILKVCPLIKILYTRSTLFYQVFKDATLFFSRGTPSLAMVIPAMDHIDQKLVNGARDLKYALSI